MSESNNNALISNILLCGCGIYGCTRSAGWAYGCFGIITANTFTWLLCYASSDLEERLSGFQRFLAYCQLLFALPCITTHIWLALSYQKELAWAHTGISLIPLIAYLADSTADRGLIDIILAVNTISLGAVSFIAEDYWYVATAVCYGCAHFIFLEKDTYNYILALFTFLAAGPVAKGGA